MTSLDLAIEQKKAQLEQLKRELATLLEARTILAQRQGSNGHKANDGSSEHHSPPPETGTPKRRQTLVDDILMTLKLMDREMTPADIRAELERTERNVPQHIVTSTLARLYREDRVWRIGPGRYVAKRTSRPTMEDGLFFPANTLDAARNITDKPEQVVNSVEQHESLSVDC
jgi:hypothetical protein